MDTLKMKFIMLGIAAFVTIALGDDPQTCSDLHSKIFEAIEYHNGSDIDTDVDASVIELMTWEYTDEGDEYESTREVPKEIKSNCSQYHDGGCKSELGVDDQEDQNAFDSAEERQKKYVYLLCEHDEMW